MSRLRWFFGHTLRQAYYAVRYRRERREMAERVLDRYAYGSAVRVVEEPERGPVTTDTVERLRESGFHELAEIAQKYVKKPRRRFWLFGKRRPA